MLRNADMSVCYHDEILGTQQTSHLPPRKSLRNLCAIGESEPTYVCLPESWSKDTAPDDSGENGRVGHLPVFELRLLGRPDRVPARLKCSRKGD